MQSVSEAQVSLSALTLFKALADDIRLKSLMIIEKEGESCVCELMVALGEESQPKVSRHLAILKRVGVLVDRKVQQWVFYAINPELEVWARQLIQNVTNQESPKIQNELERLNNMGDRPSRKLNCC